MTDLIDKAEGEISQIISRVAMRLTAEAFKMSVHIGQGVALAPYKAVAAMWNFASAKISPQHGEKVSLKAFTHLNSGGREIIAVDDKALSREFGRELKRHGVTWAVEHHADGSRTFHVEGKDPSLVQHALGVATHRVNQQMEELGSRDDGERDWGSRDDGERDWGSRDDGERDSGSRDDGEREPDSRHTESPSHDNGAVGQDPEIPAPDRTMAEQIGGPEPLKASSVPLSQPLSPRDQTRQKVRQRIAQKVKQKKEQLKAKSRVKDRTPKEVKVRK